MPPEQRTILQRCRRHTPADRILPFRPVMTLQGLVDSTIAPAPVRAALMSVFGVVGLFLASVGMFGLIKYLIKRRTRSSD